MLARVLGIAQHERDTTDGLGHPGQRCGDAVPHATVQQQVLGRIAAQGQLRKQNQGAIQLVPRPAGSRHHLVRIGIDGTNMEIQLG